MAHENVEIVGRIYREVTASRVMPRELFDADVETDLTHVTPDFGVLHGYHASQDALGPYWEMFESFHIELEEVLHADERQVVTAVRDGGRISEGDAEVWNRFFHVWTFSDGKVVRLWIHTARNRALEAAGLSE